MQQRNIYFIVDIINKLKYRKFTFGDTFLNYAAFGLHL